MLYINKYNSIYKYNSFLYIYIYISLYDFIHCICNLQCLGNTWQVMPMKLFWIELNWKQQVSIWSPLCNIYVHQNKTNGTPIDIWQYLIPIDSRAFNRVCNMSRKLLNENGRRKCESYDDKTCKVGGTEEGRLVHTHYSLR